MRLFYTLLGSRYTLKPLTLNPKLNTTHIRSPAPKRLQDEGKLEAVPEVGDPATIHAISLGLLGLGFRVLLGFTLFPNNLPV